MSSCMFGRIGCLAVAVAAVVLAAAPVMATTFHVGVGSSTDADPKVGIPAAFEEAFKAYGDLKDAKLILVTENYTGTRGDSTLNIPLVLEQAKGIPMYGAGLSSAPYAPLSRSKGFVKNVRGISVLVLGGDFEYQAEMIETGPVVYPNNRDRQANPEKFAQDRQTLVDNRQKPAEELGKRLKFGPGQNLLFVTGSLHNPEIVYAAQGLKAAIPTDTKLAVIGVAAQGGCTYFKDKTYRSAIMALVITGDFQATQGSVGPFPNTRDLDKHFTEVLKMAMPDLATQKPDLVLTVLCASWTGGPVEDQHKALVDFLPADVPFWGSYGGGEMFLSPTTGITGAGSCGVVVAIRGGPAGAAASAPASPAASAPPNVPASAPAIAPAAPPTKQ